MDAFESAYDINDTMTTKQLMKIIKNENVIVTSCYVCVGKLHVNLYDQRFRLAYDFDKEKPKGKFIVSKDNANGKQTFVGNGGKDETFVPIKDKKQSISIIKEYNNVK